MCTKLCDIVILSMLPGNDRAALVSLMNGRKIRKRRTINKVRKDSELARQQLDSEIISAIETTADENDDDDEIVPPLPPPILPPITSSVTLPPVSSHPIFPPVISRPILPPVNSRPILPPISSHSILPPVTSSPILPPSRPTYYPSTSYNPLHRWETEYWKTDCWETRFQLKQQFTEIRYKPKEFNQRLMKLEECYAPESTEEYPGIPTEKTGTVRMILLNKSMGWKAALRKILIAVFGVETLSRLCAVGKKNAHYAPLNPTVINAIKGSKN